MKRTSGHLAAADGGKPVRLGLRRTLARGAVLWERCWPALWPAAGIAGLFAALALLDALPLLPGWLHALALFAFAVLFAHRLRAGLRRIRVPTAAEASRRLETDSDLEHRPLTAIGDRPALGAADPETGRLWHAHLARAAAAARSARLRWPSPNLAGHDPYALRIALGIALAIGAVAGGPDATTRIARAFVPDLQGPGDARTATLELWIAPPDYTNLPPRLLASADPKSLAGARESVRVPVDSVLLAQVSNARGVPSLRIREAERDFESVSEDAWRIEAALDADGAHAVEIGVAGNVLGAWTVEVVPDTAPEIRFAAPPDTTESDALRLSHETEDDHGVASVQATIAWPDGPDQAGIDPIEIELPLPRPDPREGGGVSVHNLTAHPWAGLEVEVQMTATDGRGQTGATDRLAVLLPERAFNHPVAREIIEQRRVLALAPEHRRDVARSLHNIGADPRRFDLDLVVFLSLMTARSRLIHEPADKGVAPILSQLWDTALRLEDGALSLTRREIAELQERLREAIESGAGEEAVRELMNELRAALDRYLEALAQNLSQALEGMDLSSLPAAGADLDIIDGNAIQELLDQLEQMARLGDAEAVRQLLDRMQQMLQALQNAPDTLQRRQSGSPAYELLRDLRDVVRRQQDLYDDIFRRNRGGETPSAADGRELRDSQNEIRRRLGELMRRLGEMTGQIPDNFGTAEDAMGEAEGALESGSMQRALNEQERALEALRRGAQQMALQIFRQPGQGQGPGAQQGFFQPGGEGFDPLGRPLEDYDEIFEGFASNGRRPIGDGERAARALEIFEELRERLGDAARPGPELDYLERLLRRF